MSKFSKLNENQRNHGERISNHDEQISNQNKHISNQDKRICEIERVLRLGDFMPVTSPLPNWDEFQKVQRQAGTVVLTEDDKQRLAAYQLSIEPVAQKTIQSNPQNTPEKKNRRKDWCFRLVAIHGECGMTAKDIQKHAKDKGNNWRRIKKAAQLEITDTNEGQHLPYALTIADYASRMNFVLHDKIATAQIEGNTRNIQLYNSRSDQLIAIVNEINSKYPNTLKKLNAA